MSAVQKPVAVVVGATSKWQSDGRNTRLAHGKAVDDSHLPVGVRWGVGGAIAQKFGDRAREARAAIAKDTGIVRFTDGAITIVADLPKRVDWDQDRLAAIVERIRAAGDDPAEYVEIAYKVPERKYAAWPEAIRQGFEPARMVRTGTLKVEIVPQEDDQ